MGLIPLSIPDPVIRRLCESEGESITAQNAKTLIVRMIKENDERIQRERFKPEELLIS